MNAKMKVLALALLGLAGYAGSAVAGCPSSPVPPWTSVTQLPDPTSAPLLIAAGGLDGSACKLTAALPANDTAAAATVRYNNAANEPSYRAQFLVDTTNLTAFNDTTESVALMQLPATTANSGYNRILRVALVAGPAGAKRVRFIAQKGAGGPTVGQTFATDLTPGVHRIEVNLQVGAGAAGDLKYWVDAPQGTTEPPFSGEITSLDNAAWTGVAAVQLGLTAPTTPFSAAHGGQVVGFDTFDSRRQTYIGW